MLTKTEAFRRLGAELRNTVWSWSALKRDGSGVVITAWWDHFDWKSTPATYDGTSSSDVTDRLGNMERRELLKRAIADHGGVVDVVMLSAKDIKASPRSIKDCFIPENLCLRVTWLDPESGEFRAEVVRRTPVGLSP